MKEYYDFSNGRKNPHAARIKENGYSVTIHYSPKDVASSHFDDTKEIINALVELMSESESKQLLAYIKSNYDLPCSSDVWDAIKDDDSNSLPFIDSL